MPTDACHLLLGRPWQYDRDVKHDDYVNIYIFMFNKTKIVLLPSKDYLPKPKSGEGSNLLTRAQFEGEIVKTKLFFVLVAKERDAIVKPKGDVPIIIQLLLQEFAKVFLTELPEGLPPLQDIQNEIDLVPSSSLPN